MSVVDKNIQNENIELKNEIKSLKNQLNDFVKLFEKLDNACNSDDDTLYDESESESDNNSEMGECEEESTDEEIQPKSKLDNDNLEVKINN